MGVRICPDFETRSECDLKKSGAYKYSLDPTTQPTCLAIKFSNSLEILFFDFYAINRKWKSQSEDFKNLWMQAIKDRSLFSAHNAFFEKCIYENILVARYGWPSIPDNLWRCTAAKAAACALPRNLEGAGAALNLAVQKDKRGYAAVMATCKPVKLWNTWNKKKTGPEPRQKFLEVDDRPDVFDTLYTYCKIDVKTEELLDKSLPDLNPVEQEIWHFNQLLNWRGLPIDIPLVQKIIGIMEIESKKRLKELDHLTAGLVTKPGARKSILDFLAAEGIELPDLRAKTVSDKLEGFELRKDTRRLLELRKALSLTSTKKYQAFLNRANDDHRVRDILMYHGASTGRDTGTGIQPHNFPKPLIKMNKLDPYEHVNNVINYDTEMLKLIYGEDGLPILFSSILRNMIIPTKGRELFVGDFSKIEVAVLWWLAGNKPGLRILNSGKDPYIFMAAINTGKTYEEIEKALENEDKWAIDARQLGKAQVLGNGFGMGWMKFKQTAWDMYRLKLSDEQAQVAVNNYRKANSAVPTLWRAYEDAAVAAIQNKGKVFTANKCSFGVFNKFLWIRLPSGRKLAYREPSLGLRQTDYGERLTIEFMAVNSKTKKWGHERTWGGTLTENIVQAVARDLLMPAMVRLEKKGYQGLLMVHDEAICEREIGKGSIDEFVKILCEKPKWADQSLPLEAKGWSGPRYRK